LLTAGSRQLGEHEHELKRWDHLTRLQFESGVLSCANDRVRVHAILGGWPWASSDPVHAREEGRFARRPDGTLITHGV
jgi:hypothetical protein